MAPVPKNTKFHFTHPNHPLIFLSDDQDYYCDGCKTIGSDSRFRCHGCDFDLHEFCANCPEKLSLFIHHHHLTLDVLKPEAAAPGGRFCDVCLGPVEGLYYRCKDCNFDAHPLCTQLPQELDHVIDKNHPLNLQKLPFGSCVVCTTDCSSRWVYGCDICGLNIHLDCLLEPYDSPPARSLDRASSSTAEWDYLTWDFVCTAAVANWANWTTSSSLWFRRPLFWLSCWIRVWIFLQ